MTLLITAVNVVVFALAERAGSTTSSDTLVQFGASARVLVWSGEYWRLVTPMFLHIGLFHLVWNTWAGFGWLRTVETLMGSPRFVLAYLSCGIAATSVSLLGHDVLSAGASGAGSGMIGMLLAVQYRLSPSLDAFWKQASPTLIQLGLWFVIGAVALPIDNFAHGGGLVFGALLGLAFTASHGARWKTGAVLAAIAVLAALTLHPLPWMAPARQLAFDT